MSGGVAQVTRLEFDSGLARFTVAVRRLDTDSYLGKPPNVSDLPADIRQALVDWLEGAR